MKSIEETMDYLDVLIADEEDQLREIRAEGDLTSLGGWVCQEMLETLRNLKLWILEL